MDKIPSSCVHHCHHHISSPPPPCHVHAGAARTRSSVAGPPEPSAPKALLSTTSVVGFQSALVGWAEGLKTGRERLDTLTILGCPVALTTTKEGDAMKNAVVQGTLVPGMLAWRSHRQHPMPPSLLVDTYTTREDVWLLAYKITRGVLPTSLHHTPLSALVRQQLGSGSRL